MDDTCSRGEDLFTELSHAVLVGLTALRTEWIVDAIVHAITGKDELGFCFFQHPVEALVQVWAGKTATGMAGLTQAGKGLAGQADREKIIFYIGMPGDESGFYDLKIAARLGDAIAEKNDAFFCGWSTGSCGNGKKQ